MIDILRKPDDVKIYCDGENTDTVVKTELNGRKLNVTVSAKESKPKMVCLRWNNPVRKPTHVLGDKWERTYVDMEWRSLSGDVFMPWYFLANDDECTVGCGVMTGANSFVSFQCDVQGVTAWFDVRCGGVGVELNGRELLAGVIVCEKYEGISAFDAAKKFCAVMCENPVFPKEPVYGSNNWYYAYGESSFEEIMEDAKLIAKIAGANKNRPFMVIDDGWQQGFCSGPWVANDKYKDMAKVVDGFKEIGVKPGIWVRTLHDEELEKAHPDWCITRKDVPTFLDPSHPEVKKYIRKVITDIVGWGFELIKHDYSTYDMFGDYGMKLNGMITNIKDWAFYDRSKTGAEITLDFYRLLREAAGDAIIIGCNTIGHLCAGLFELNRTGDDTSGRIWSRTRAVGLNTLAFRMCQHDTFYKIDADCVGVMGDNIPWKLNRQWLDLLARSGTPLFVSMQPSAITPEMEGELKRAFEISSVQKDVAEPIDWMYNKEPQSWLINGERVDYDFIMDDYPHLLKNFTHPMLNKLNF